MFQLGKSLQDVWRNHLLLTEMGSDKWRQTVEKAVRSREKQLWWRSVQERSTTSLRLYSQLKRGAAGLALEAYLSAPPAERPRPSRAEGADAYTLWPP